MFTGCVTALMQVFLKFADCIELFADYIYNKLFPYGRSLLEDIA